MARPGGHCSMVASTLPLDLQDSVLSLPLLVLPALWTIRSSWQWKKGRTVHFRPCCRVKPQERETEWNTRCRQGTSVWYPPDRMKWLLFLSSVSQLVQLWPLVGMSRKRERLGPEKEAGMWAGKRTETLESSGLRNESQGTDCLVWRPSMARGAFVLLSRLTLLFLLFNQKDLLWSYPLGILLEQKYNRCILRHMMKGTHGQSDKERTRQKR